MNKNKNGTEFEAQLKALQETVNKLSASDSLHLHAKDQLKKEIDRLSVAINDTKKERDALNKEVSGLKKEKESLSKSIADGEVAYDKLKAERESFVVALDKLKKSHKEAESDVAGLTAQADTLVKLTKSIEKDNKELQGKLNAEIEEKVKKMDETIASVAKGSESLKKLTLN